MASARQKVAGALMGAMMFGDTGAQIRYLAAVGHAYVQLGSYDDALGYFDKALKIAAANPDAGYQFVVNEGRLQAFRGMGKLDAAEQLANEIITQAQARQKHVKETQALITAGTVENAKSDEAKAMESFERASSFTSATCPAITLPSIFVTTIPAFRNCSRAAVRSVERMKSGVRIKSCQRHWARSSSKNATPGFFPHQSPSSFATA